MGKILNKYNINWVIYSADSPLSHLLAERDDWKLVYADNIADIFVRDIPEYRPLINRYGNVKPVEAKDETSAK